MQDLFEPIDLTFNPLLTNSNGSFSFTNTLSSLTRDQTLTSNVIGQMFSPQPIWKLEEPCVRCFAGIEPGSCSEWCANCALDLVFSADD